MSYRLCLSSLEYDPLFVVSTVTSLDYNVVYFIIYLFRQEKEGKNFQNQMVASFSRI
jgi:hypothetical protein